MLVVKNEKRTEGEQRFEDYLNAMGYPFAFEEAHPNKNKRPDYTLKFSGNTYLFDVKDADAYAPRGFNQFDPHPEIIERIKAGLKKFREFKEFSCCIVLQNNGNVHMMNEEPSVMLGAMYGKIGFRVPLHVGEGLRSEPAPPVQPVFTGGAQFQPNRNTRISALITIRRIGIGKRRLRRIQQDNPNLGFWEAYNQTAERFGADFFEELRQGVIVWENVYARVPLPRDLFNGPWDERYGLDGGDITRIFCGSAFEEFDY